MLTRRGILIAFISCVVGAAALAQSTITVGSVTQNGSGSNVDVATGDSTASSFRVFNPANATLLYVKGDGHVGIGTAAPQARLHVEDIADDVEMVLSAGDEPGISNSATLTFLRKDSQDSPVAKYGWRLDADDEDKFKLLHGTTGAFGTSALLTASVTPSGAFLTVGDLAQRGFLHVAGGATTDVFAGMGVDVNAGPAFTFGYAGFSYGRSSGFFNVRPDASAVAPNPSLRFATANVQRMIVTNTGAVGIGTSYVPAAGYQLDVNGNVRFTGQLAANGSVTIGTSTAAANLHVHGTVTGNYIMAHYQDVAEWVPSRNDLEQGTVVVIDSELGNGVKASSFAYDTAVAGVVSAQPGLILGEGADGKEMVATSGRVKVKVDATRAPIGVGDLLVTSDQRGVAMKSVPMDLNGRKFHQPGTILGKALEPLASGQGEVLVLLSLQ